MNDIPKIYTLDTSRKPKKTDEGWLVPVINDKNEPEEFFMSDDDMIHFLEINKLIGFNKFEGRVH